MPDRWLREALLSSQRFNDLGFAAQSLYVRLVLVVDDFGSTDGRDNVIAAACFPTQRVDVGDMLAQLQAADLVVRYSNAGKPYLALMRWQNDLRGKRRFPAPPINNESIENLPNVRGKYARPIGWRNPGGADLVSLLLDAQMRPLPVQPPEWRLVDKDYAPATDGVQPLSTTGTQPLHTMVPKPYQQVVVEVEVQDSDKVLVPVQVQPSSPPPAPQHGPQPLQPTTPQPNGEIKLNSDGEWIGVDEPLRLRWQDMCASISIPDELARAGQWLLANVEERRLYEAQPDGLRAYLIRWVLKAERDAARTSPARAPVDSQGKR